MIPVELYDSIGQRLELGRKFAFARNEFIPAKSFQVGALDVSARQFDKARIR
jgi:hypothetical protein